MSIGHDEAAALLGSMSSLVRATRAVAHRQSGDMGASGTPIGVLKTLRAGDARPSDLAAALHVAPSVVSRAIVPLESAGLVERTTDPADGRASLIGITTLGCRRLAQLQNVYVEQVSEMLTDWTDGEAQQAAQMLDRLERALTEVTAPEAHRRLFSSALIATTPSPDPNSPTPDVPDPNSPTPDEPAPNSPTPDSPPDLADTAVDTPPAVSTRKPVHA
ncbi:MAG: MarR family transcriptional regulator [Propionibacteriaceae bacterium]